MLTASDDIRHRSWWQIWDVECGQMEWWMSHRIGSRFSKMLKRWTLLGKVCTSSTVKMISWEDWQEKREGSSRIKNLDGLLLPVFSNFQVLIPLFFSSYNFFLLNRPINEHSPRLARSMCWETTFFKVEDPIIVPSLTLHHSITHHPPPTLPPCLQNLPVLEASFSSIRDKETGQTRYATSMKVLGRP